MSVVYKTATAKKSEDVKLPQSRFVVTCGCGQLRLETHDGQRAVHALTEHHIATGHVCSVHGEVRG